MQASIKWKKPIDLVTQFFFSSDQIGWLVELNFVAIVEWTVINYLYRDKCIHCVIKVLSQSIFTCRTIYYWTSKKQSILMTINYRYSINCSMLRFFFFYLQKKKRMCAQSTDWIYDLNIFLFARKITYLHHWFNFLGLVHGESVKRVNFFDFQGKKKCFFFFSVGIKEEMWIECVYSD